MSCRSPCDRADHDLARRRDAVADEQRLAARPCPRTSPSPPSARRAGRSRASRNCSPTTFMPAMSPRSRISLGGDPLRDRLARQCPDALLLAPLQLFRDLIQDLHAVPLPRLARCRRIRSRHLAGPALARRTDTPSAKRVDLAIAPGDDHARHRLERLHQHSSRAGVMPISSGASAAKSARCPLSASRSSRGCSAGRPAAPGRADLCRPPRPQRSPPARPPARSTALDAAASSIDRERELARGEAAPRSARSTAAPTVTAKSASALGARDRSPRAASRARCAPRRGRSPRTRARSISAAMPDRLGELRAQSSRALRASASARCARRAAAVRDGTPQPLEDPPPDGGQRRLEPAISIGRVPCLTAPARQRVHAAALRLALHQLAPAPLLRRRAAATACAAAISRSTSRWARSPSVSPPSSSQRERLRAVDDRARACSARRAGAGACASRSAGAPRAAAPRRAAAPGSPPRLDAAHQAQRHAADLVVEDQLLQALAALEVEHARAPRCC